MKSKKNRISVVIVTKNRSTELKKCLDSLSLQSVFPDELVVINNASTDSTESVVNIFAKTVSFPVRLVEETKHGYPAIYNKGLKEASFPWVAFIDDDCIATPAWLDNFSRAIRKFPSSAAFLGRSESQCRQNPYSLTTYMLNYVWKENGTEGNTVMDGEILDNKNIVYNAVFLRKHKIQFNEQRVIYRNGSSEDCELGNRIVLAGGICLYIRNAVVSHKDPTTFRAFFNKYVKSYMGYLHFRLYDKPEEEKKKYQGKKKLKMRDFLPIIIERNKLSFVAAVQMYLIVIFILSIQKSLTFYSYYRHKLLYRTGLTV